MEDLKPLIAVIRKRINASISALDGVTGDGVSGKLTLKKSIRTSQLLTL